MNMDPGRDQLPLYFNSAEKWPGKIHEPLDQGNCAASWAFSTAGKAGRKITFLLQDIIKEWWERDNQTGSGING